MINLHLEAFKNNLFELDFSASKKGVSTVKPSQEDEFFGTVLKFFKGSVGTKYLSAERVKTQGINYLQVKIFSMLVPVSRVAFPVLRLN